VQSYKTKLQTDGLAPATVNLHLSAIRRLATEAADNGLLNPDTAAAVRRVKGIKAEVVPAGREVTPGELAGLMLICSDDPTPAGARDAAILGVLYVEGLRRSEVAALDLGDFDPGTGALTVRAGKGNKQRVVYITNGAADALADWLAVRPECQTSALFVTLGRSTGKPLKTQGVARMLSRRKNAARVTGPCNPHAFRHGFAKAYLMTGGDLGTLSGLMGHSDMQVTKQFYGFFSIEELQRKHGLHSPLVRLRGALPHE
jgi:site-specific recombinase XerD